MPDPGGSPRAAVASGDLDAAVATASAALDAGWPRPDALLLCATGAGPLPDRLADARAVALGELPGTPDAWADSTLIAGRLGELEAWVVDDDGALAGPGGAPAWATAFPVWLAAARGAMALLHTSAGAALDGRTPGSLAVGRDHLRLGDANPLVGLGPSELGPMFPDLSFLHDGELREAALREARELGLEAREAVIACTPGPSIDTPAERHAHARVGAEVVVQNLSAPLLAAGHAGLAVLTLVAIIDGGDGPTDVPGLLERAERLAPAIEELVARLSPALAARAADLRKDRAS